MSTEISMWVIVQLPDETLEQATAAQTTLAAWKALNEALQSVKVAKSDFYIGPAKSGSVKRRRAGRPQLTTVKPPPTAA